MVDLRRQFPQSSSSSSSQTPQSPSSLVAELRRLFTTHPRKMGESYCSHLGYCCWIAARCTLIGAGALTHGLCPFMLDNFAEHHADALAAELAARLARHGHTHDDADATVEKEEPAKSRVNNANTEADGAREHNVQSRVNTEADGEQERNVADTEATVASPAAMAASRDRDRDHDQHEGDRDQHEGDRDRVAAAGVAVCVPVEYIEATAGPVYECDL
jgi:hypothetical protein